MAIDELAIWSFVILMVLAFSYSSLVSWRISRWPYVIGTLSKAEIEYLHMVERGSAWTDVSYEYEVEGSIYTGTRLSPLVVHGQVSPRIKKQIAKIQHVSGDQVKVFYDPQKPEKSYLVKETWLNLFG